MRNERRLALGTVQFGLRYGIANKAGQVSPTDAAAILSHAWRVGVDTLDTAIAYGESEQRLGEFGVQRWRVISKLPPVPETCADVGEWAERAVVASLDRLRIPKLYGLLLHRSGQLLDDRGDALYAALQRLKERGRVEKIGVSIYGPDELDRLWPHYQFDLVQAPFNIIDRRLATSGWLTRLHQSSTEIHIRSVFLQGLLLMNAVERPPFFDRWQPLWRHWHAWLAQTPVSPLQACLAYGLAQAEVDRVVVGVDTLAQLQEIVAATDAPAPAPPVDLISEDLDLINPSRWSTH